MTSQNRRPTMKDNQAKYPQLRFKGFTDPWEQRKLIDLLNQPITDGPHETPNLVEKGIPFISADAIVDNRIDFSRKRGFITEEYDLQCRKKYGPELYDVYLVKSGSTVGKVAIVETTKQFNIWSPLAAMRCKGKTNPYFLYFLFQTKENQNQVKSKASNGTQPNLSMRELEQFNVQTSPLHDEQQKIGAFFKQLDSLITLHQRKLAKLKKLKKGYLQKLFPENGSKFPQLRFAGFADAWEKRKLGEISKTTIGEFVIKNKQDSDAPYPVYNGGISYTGFYDEFNNEGDKIVISARGANAGFVNYIDGRFWAGNSCYSVDILDRKKFSVEFMYQFLKRNQHLFTDYQQAANIPSVSKKDVATFIVQFPTQNEQREIASFFKQLDNLITLHQRKLEKLQELKKGYLQKMFC